MARLISDQDELFADDCHCAVEPEARFPIVRVTLFPLQIVDWLAVGEGARLLEELYALVSVT